MTQRGRGALAEFLGTGLLVAAIVGSGIAAQRLSPGTVGIELLENALATAGALYALITVLGPISGAHLNPVVTLASRWFGDISSSDAVAYVAAQCGGAVCGAVAANAMFGVPSLEWSVHHRASAPHVVAEALATFGLVLVIFGLTRSGRGLRVAACVAAYIFAAYWFTSSTSFANPAVAIGRMFSNTFSGISPSSAPAFIVAELVGGAVGTACVVALFPRVAASTREPLESSREAV